MEICGLPKQAMKMPDSEWDWPADGRSTGRNTSETGNLPTSVVGGRAPWDYARMAVLVAVAAFMVLGAGWMIWTMLAAPTH